MRRRRSWRKHAAAPTRGGPRPADIRPQRHISALARRVGTGPLLALALAASLLALVLCAVLVPGFVMGAEPEAVAAGDQTSTTGSSESESPALEPSPAGPMPQGTALVTLPWGNGPGQLGLAKATEGLTRGPEALAVAPDGRVAILDSVNRRLVLLAEDGTPVRTVPLVLSQPRFLAVDNGVIYVLDSESDRRLACLDWQGTEVGGGSLPVLDDVVTGLFATDAGACLEVAHDAVFLIDLKDGAEQGAEGDRTVPAALRALAGRPLDRDLAKEVKIIFKPEQGLKLKRFKVDKKTFKTLQTKGSSLSFPADREIEHLVSADGDGMGGLIVGARLLRSPDAAADSPSLVIGCLASVDQQEVQSVMAEALSLCDSPFAYLGQPYVVAPDGRIFQPVGSEAGYTILIHSLPGGDADQEVQP
jgi:hypothetical protein